MIRRALYPIYYLLPDKKQTIAKSIDQIKNPRLTIR